MKFASFLDINLKFFHSLNLVNYVLCIILNYRKMIKIIINSMISNIRRKKSFVETRSVRKKIKVTDSIVIDREISNLDCEVNLINSMDLDDNLYK